MMNSREVISRTLDFENPERVARSFANSDFVRCGCVVETPYTDWYPTGKGESEMIDEWGNTWGRIDDISKGEIVKGVLDELSSIDSYEFPDYSRKESYDSARKVREEHPDMWMNGSVPGFAFNIARKMRKLDQYLVDLLLEPEIMQGLHDRIDAMIEDMIRNYAAAGADGVMFAEDWGTQDRTLVSPELWHEEFGPRFVKLCGIAHELGLKVFMHSCGAIGAIVPGLIEAGVDCLQFDQPTLHGIDKLAGYQEDAKITFWCPVDIQRTLQTKDEGQIRAEAREMLDKLWKGRGGFIAGFYSDEPAIGLGPEWQEIASDEFSKHGIESNYR